MLLQSPFTAYSQLCVNGRLDRVLATSERFQEIRARRNSGLRTITQVSGVSFYSDQNLDEMKAV